MENDKPNLAYRRFDIFQNNYLLRNFKIYQSADRSNLVYHFPFKDENNIGANLVPGGLQGTPTSLKVVDRNYDDGNWAYFNGSDSAVWWGNTTTFAWMGGGTFSMEFDMVIHSTPGSKTVFATAYSGTHKGLRLLYSSSVFQLSWFNGTAAVSVNMLIHLLNRSRMCHYSIRGDGSYIYYTTTDALTGELIQTNEPTGLAITPYTGNTTYKPSIGSLNGSLANVYNSHISIRNFKIWTDTNKTIPFFELTFQDKNVSPYRDLVSGTLLSYNNVQLLNRNLNVLKSTDLWCRFGLPDGTTLGRIYPIGDITSFNWIHQTGIFKIEWEWTIEQLTTSPDIPFTTRVAAAANGIYAFHSYNTGSGERFYVYFGSGGANILTNYWNVFYSTGKYKMILIGDGTGITLWAGLNGATPTSYGKLNFTGAIVGSGDAGLIMTIGGYSTTSAMRGKIRDFKFYTDAEGTQLMYHFPLKDNTNLGGDIAGNLGSAGTVVLTNQPGISAVDIS